MTQALIDNLPLIAAAPDGIKALRGLILDLAVRGKLVPQDPEDEPASELLKRIAAEKAQVAKGRGAQVLPHLFARGADKSPFPIASSWAWADFGSIVISRDSERIPVSKEDRNKRAKIYDYYGASGIIDKIDDYIFDKPLLLIGEDGANLLSRSTPIAFIARGKYWVNNHAHVLDGVCEDFLRYLELFINATNLEAYVTGTAQPKMNQAKMNSIPVPLPPLAEQRRIVAKVDELMALCDRLEAQQADAEAVHAALVKTLLDTLTQSQDAEDFAANWQRLSQHFPIIFTTEAAVDALKHAVVELAVAGKLVSQDSEDEAASAFLEQIQSARVRLIPGKMEKADKALPALTADALPFCPPSGWEWVRFDEIVMISGGLTLGRTFAGRELVSRPYLRVANVQRGHLALSEVKEVLVPPEEVEKYRLRPHDLLITEGGDWDKVGRTAIWRGEIDNCLHQNHVFKARPFISDFNDRWAELYLNSAVARSYFAGASKQTTNLASINMTQLKACLLPLPPLAEQRRIVAKVDELFALCDSLKAQIAEARAVQRQLATALVEETLAA